MTDKFDENTEIGVGSTTLDYLKIRYAWLGELINETDAELKRLRAEIEWRKMREELTSVLLKWYETRDAFITPILDCRSRDIDRRVAVACDWEDGNPKPPKPEDAPLPTGVAK